jgi:hypothetical protein
MDISRSGKRIWIFELNWTGCGLLASSGTIFPMRLQDDRSEHSGILKFREAAAHSRPEV